jgi:hypothetical protein
MRIIRAVMVAFIILSVFGCVGAYRLEQPLGPMKGDKLPVCDANRKCERT